MSPVNLPLTVGFKCSDLGATREQIMLWTGGVCVYSSTHHIGLVHLDGHFTDSICCFVYHFQEAGAAQSLGACRSGQLKTNTHTHTPAVITLRINTQIYSKSLPKGRFHHEFVEGFSCVCGSVTVLKITIFWAKQKLDKCLLSEESPEVLQIHFHLTSSLSRNSLTSGSWRSDGWFTTLWTYLFKGYIVERRLTLLLVGAEQLWDLWDRTCFFSYRSKAPLLLSMKSADEESSFPTFIFVIPVQDNIHCHSYRGLHSHLQYMRKCEERN